MHIRKFLSIFLIGLVFAIAGCSSDSTSGISEEDKLPDTDNDGIVNNHDGDIDGDGKPNQNDDDIDGDGVTNDQDGDDDGDGIADGGDSTPEGPPSVNGDSDGDGTPDKNDPTPGGDAARACTSAKMYPPKDGITGVLNTVSWKLGPTGCDASATVNRTVVVTASYAGVTTESDPASLGKLTTNIKLPHDCGWRGTVPITYDFSEIGNALGDTTGTYTTDRRAIVNNRSDQRCEADPCTSAKIKWPTAGITPGQAAALDWHLLPVGCALSDSQLEKKVAPTGTSHATTTTGASELMDKGRSRIIVPCAPGAPEGKTEKRDIAWDFSELATALGDPNLSAYKATVTQAAAANGCSECTSAKIKWPNTGITPGQTGDVGFELFPENCSITDAMKSALPTGTSHETTTTGQAQRNNPNKETDRASKIEIPCAPNAPEGITAKREIKWDFSKLATALGDSNVGAYKTTVTQAAAANGCAGDN